MMWHSCLRLLVVVAACLMMASLEVGSHPSETKRSLQLCGTNLADILQVVCRGSYNGQFTRSRKSEVSDDILTPNENTEGDLGAWIESQPEKESIYPFRPRPRATSLINGAFRRFTRGVYDECCLKSCTIDELSGYCAKRLR